MIDSEKHETETICSFCSASSTSNDNVLFMKGIGDTCICAECIELGRDIIGYHRVMKLGGVNDHG